MAPLHYKSLTFVPIPVPIPVPVPVPVPRNIFIKPTYPMNTPQNIPEAMAETDGMIHRTQHMA
ncbi:hypothetical protein N7453_005074 [Penicillium expansum]|nr:hypothetical protein N7453_005074 [Penicillium expansum]